MPYFDDFRAALCNDGRSEFDVGDSWENYEKLKPVVDAAFAS